MSDNISLDDLTPEQKKDIDVSRETWKAHSLSTERVDVEKAKAAIIKTYECEGYTPPKYFIYVQNPMIGCIAATFLEDNVTDKILTKQFEEQKVDTLRLSDSDIRSLVGESNWERKKQDFSGMVYKACYGSHDAPWLCFHDFFHRHFGKSKNALGLIDLAKTCGWMWAFETVAIFTDRPTKLELNDSNELHNEEGAAVAYNSDFDIYVVNGTNIPKEWVESPDTVDPVSVLREENVEKRVIGCRLLGWHRFLDKLNHKVLDGDKESEVGALVSVELPDLPDPGLFLMAKCPRNGTIMEGVPPVSDIDNKEITTALQAQAWKAGLAAKNFAMPTSRT